MYENCRTCAQEFEKQKELASAALAYKCMEVACMKIVYCKSLLTRQDLQTSLQMVTHGMCMSPFILYSRETMFVPNRKNNIFDHFYQVL